MGCESWVVIRCKILGAHGPVDSCQFLGQITFGYLEIQAENASDECNAGEWKVQICNTVKKVYQLYFKNNLQNNPLHVQSFLEAKAPPCSASSGEIEK